MAMAGLHRAMGDRGNEAPTELLLAGTRRRSLADLAAFTLSDSHDRHRDGLIFRAIDQTAPSHTRDGFLAAGPRALWTRR